MPRIEFRFDIAAILLASVLSALGMSAAQASVNEGRDSELRRHCEAHVGVTLAGGKGGVSGGDVRSRSRSSGGRQ